MAWHTLPITQGSDDAEAFMSGPLGWIVRSVLPMFFALSGFLVAASLERNTIKTFLVFRALRIAPALAVEITLSALILGPLLTTASLQQYFTHPDFYSYFLNVIGVVRYVLPGVYETNPYPFIVNGSLATVPYELECYIALVAMALLGMTKRPGWFFAIILAGAATLVAIDLTFERQEFVAHRAVPSRILILSFLAGVLLQMLRARIPYSLKLFIPAIIVTIICLNAPLLYAFAPIPIAYVTVFLGLQNPPRFSLLQRGDYSYGIYLYAFPIQQAVATLMPPSWLLFPASLILVAAFAGFSWHCIERPALRLKTIFTSPALTASSRTEAPLQG